MGKWLLVLITFLIQIVNFRPFWPKTMIFLTFMLINFLVPQSNYTESVTFNYFANQNINCKSILEIWLFNHSSMHLVRIWAALMLFSILTGNGCCWGKRTIWRGWTTWTYWSWRKVCWRLLWRRWGHHWWRGAWCTRLRIWHLTFKHYYWKRWN